MKRSWIYHKCTTAIYFLILLVQCGTIWAQDKITKKPMKLISYNVYWGMKQDSTTDKSKFAEWIRKQDPDILALQEMNGFTAGIYEFAPKGANPNNLRKLAESYGHPYVVIVREPSTDGSVTFPVAITSKYPIINVNRVLDNNIHGFIEAEIEGLHFIVTHFHPFSSQKRSYEIDQILATIKSKPTNQKWMFMGDLNSVSPLDKSAYKDNKLRNFIREDRKKRPHNQNLGIDDALDYTIQQKILDFGFIDALRYFHPEFDATAPTKLFYDQSKSPVRYDYLYVSGNMKKDITKCEIIKDSFTDIYSDHYPVVLYFNK